MGNELVGVEATLDKIYALLSNARNQTLSTLPPLTGKQRDGELCVLRRTKKDDARRLIDCYTHS